MFYLRMEKNRKNTKIALKILSNLNNKENLMKIIVKNRNSKSKFC